MWSPRGFIDPSLADAADIALVSVLAYGLLAGLRRIRLRGILLSVLGLVPVYVFAELFSPDDGLCPASSEPGVVKIVVSGPRRAFFLVGAGVVRGETGAFDLEPGNHEPPLTASDLALPEGVALTNTWPPTIGMHVERDSR